MHRQFILMIRHELRCSRIVTAAPMIIYAIGQAQMRAYMPTRRVSFHGDEAFISADVVGDYRYRAALDTAKRR